MENRSNISGISDRSLSNFTHFSDETMSNISDLSTSKVNYSDLNQNQQIVKQTSKVEFWKTYADIIKHSQFEKGFLLAEYLLAKFNINGNMRINRPKDLPEQWIELVDSFANGSLMMGKWQKAYYRGMARSCMSQCLYFSDGKYYFFMFSNLN